MPEPLLQIILNPPVRGITEPWQSVTASFPSDAPRQGTQQGASGWWIDPDATTLTLLPWNLDETFSASAANVPRLRLAQFDAFLPPGWSGHDTASWQEAAGNFPTDYFLLSDGSDEILQTKYVYEKNRGFLLRFKAFGTSNNVYQVCQVWFGQYKLCIGSDGLCKLYDIADETTPRMEGRIAAPGSNLTKQDVQLLILPYRRREILFLSQAGHFRYIDDRLKADTKADSAYAITTARAFAIRFPYCKAQFQVTPLTYYSAAAWESQPYLFTRAPKAGVTPVGEIAGDTWHGTGLIGQVEKSDHSGAFVADGNEMMFSYALAMSSGTQHTHSPMAYFARFSVEGTATVTTNVSTDITADVLPGLTLKLDEDFTQDELTFQIKNPEDNNVNGMYGTVVSVRFDGNEYWRGIVTETKYGLQPVAGAEIGQVTCRNWFAERLKNTRMAAAGTFNELSHPDAMEYLFEFCGIDPDHEIIMDADTNVLRGVKDSEQDGKETDDWKPNDGDTALDWAQKIREEFTGDWILDTYYQGGLASLRYVSWQAKSKTSARTFYPDGSVSPSEWEKWARECDLSVIPPECNELWVVGCTDLGQPIACMYYDKDSQNPDLPPESRPYNWIGERRLAIVRRTCLRDMDTLKLACRNISREVMRSIRTASIEAEWRPGVWRNDVVHLEPYGDYRVKSMTITFSAEFEAAQYRACKYELEALE